MSYYDEDGDEFNKYGSYHYSKTYDCIEGLECSLRFKAMLFGNSDEDEKAPEWPGNTNATIMKQEWNKTVRVGLEKLRVIKNRAFNW